MVCFSKTNQTIKHSVSPKDSPVPGRRAQTPSLAEFKQLRAGDTKMAVSLFICYQAWKEGLFFKCQPGILVIDRQSIVILGVLLVVSSPQLSSRRSFVLSWSYSLFLVLDLHGHRTMFTCSPFCCVVMFAARGIWWLTLTHIIMEPKKGRLQTNTIPFFLGLCLSAFVDYNELWSLMFAYFCRHWFCLMLALNRQIDCEKSWHTAIARWRLRQLSGAMVRMQAAVVGDPHQLLLILAYVHVDFLELAFNPTFVLTFQLT